MTNNYINVYNNLIKLTRNKNLYLILERNDEFSDRLLFLMFHFALFLKKFKSEIEKKSIVGKVFIFLFLFIFFFQPRYVGWKKKKWMEKKMDENLKKKKDKNGGKKKKIDKIFQ